jgi:hypothetical protein
MFQADVDVAFFAEEVSGVNNQVLRIAHLAGKVVGKPTGAIGDVPALFQNDDLKLGIQFTGAARRTHPRCHSTDNDKSLARHRDLRRKYEPPS